MRNAGNRAGRSPAAARKRAVLATIAGASLMIGLVACQADPQVRARLDAGEESLKAAEKSTRDHQDAVAGRQYDQAAAAAEEVLGKGTPDAEAYYLRGRAQEERPKADQAAVQRDLAHAKADYLSALNLAPPKPLDGRVRAQLGNICYFQDDYAGALQQWTVAYDELDHPEWKSWVLYRMGLCEQRLGRFTDADQTFERVQREFPSSEPAIRARAHEGARSFSVQVGAFAMSDAVEKATAALQAAGMTSARSSEKGLTVVRSGPVPSYQQALILKNRLAGQYPDATVLP